MITELHKKIFWKRTDYLRRKYETAYHAFFKKVLNKQFSELAKKVTVTNFQDEQLPEKIMDGKDIERMIFNCYQIVGTAFAKETYRKGKKSEPTEDLWHQRMIHYAREKATEKVTSINKASIALAKQLMRTVLEQSFEEGWGTEKTASEIRNSLIEDSIEINKWRAMRIARTEIACSSNAGSWEGAKELGMPMVKYWIATRDEKTRPEHMEADEQSPKDMNEAFIVGESRMKYPGDPEGDVSEIVNCRCAVSFELKNIA